MDLVVEKRETGENGWLRVVFWWGGVWVKQGCEWIWGVKGNIQRSLEPVG